MTKFYIDNQSKYIGGFDGALPPIGSIEVPIAPEDAMMTWDGSKWVVPPAEKDEFVDKERLQAYNAEGAQIHELVVALWKRVVENDPTDSDAIEVIRKKIQSQFPK